MKKILLCMVLFFFISGSFVLPFSSVLASSDLVEDSWNTKTPMTHGQTGCGFAVLDGKIYAIGGYYTDINERYDPATDTWTTLAPMPTPRGAVNVVAYQDKIYCIGGITNNVGPGPAIYRALNTVEVYDPTTNSWSSKAAVPLKGTYSHEMYYYADMKAYVVNKQLFAIASSGELYMYNPSTDSWSSKASLSVENWYPQVYVTNEQLFVIPKAGEMHMYNPATDAWTKKTNTPNSDSNYILYPFVTVADNKIIIGDHQKTDSSTGSVQLNLRIYDPKTDVWSERKTNSKSAIFYGGSMFVGATTGAYAPKKLYIFGYEQAGKDSFQAFTWVYDPVGDVWSTAKAITTFRNVLATNLIVDDDVFYLIGSTFNDQYIPTGYDPQGYPNTPPPATSPPATTPSTTTPSASDGTSSQTPPEPKTSESFLTGYIVAAAAVLTTTCVIVITLCFYLRGKKETRR